MSFMSSQEEMLRKIFNDIADEENASVNEDGLRKLLADLDIDETFAGPMMRIICGSKNKQNVDYDQFLSFFHILLSQNIKQFFELLFNAIDSNGDGQLNSEDIVEFGKIIGDEITVEESEQIIQQCDLDNSGSIEFNDFWKWFSDER